jgi:hypothetical protein
VVADIRAETPEMAWGGLDRSKGWQLGLFYTFTIKVCPVICNIYGRSGLCTVNL